MFWMHSIETLCTPSYCDNFLGLSMPDATQCASNPDSLHPARRAIRDQRPKAVAKSAGMYRHVRRCAKQNASAAVCFALRRVSLIMKERNEIMLLRFACPCCAISRHFAFVLSPSLDLLRKSAVSAPIKGNRGFASDKRCCRTRSPRWRTRRSNARALYVRLASVNGWSSLRTRRHDQVPCGFASGGTCSNIAIREWIWRTQRAVTSIETITVPVERMTTQVSIVTFRADQRHSGRRRHGLVGRACHTFAVGGW
jgi:hypothetical protein